MASDPAQDSELISALKNVQVWVRTIAVILIAERFDKEIGSDPKDLLLYHLSDGKNTAEIIGNTIGLHKGNVTRRWKKWARSGLVVPSASRQGRWERVISLEDLGIDVPKPENVVPLDPDALRVSLGDQ